MAAPEQVGLAPGGLPPAALANLLARPPPQQAGPSGNGGASGGLDVAALEDDQLYSIILSMDPPPAPPLPAGLEERRPTVSIDDARKAIQAAKAAAGVKPAKAEAEAGGSGSEDDDFSPKGRNGKSKRVMANRQSAQRSRLRKLQYIQDLESNVDRLQGEICQIQPQLAFLREKYSGLSAQNHKLRDQVAALLNEARYKDSVNSSLREEIAHMLAKGQPAAGAASLPLGPQQRAGGRARRAHLAAAGAGGEAAPLRPEGLEGFPPQAAAPHFSAAV